VFVFSLKRLPRTLVLAGAFAVAACGGHSTSNSIVPPPAGSPKIQCPADVTVGAVSSLPTVVTYPSPTTTDGSAPVTTTCTVASGSAFPVGMTDVICTATDSASRQGSCVFHVTVASAPKLQGTRFLAFGDSITAGEVTMFSQLLDVRPELSYPTVLQKSLASRYNPQTTAVINCGLSAELASDGRARLRDVLVNGAPCPNGSTPGSVDALLLLEGINDINSNDDNAIGHAREGLRADIRYAKSVGVKQVYLATLTPEFVDGGESVPDMNDEIRSLAMSEGVVLVDVYAAFGGGSSTLIGVDGIHPTVQGYQVLAQTFLTAIQSTFEVPASSSSLRRTRQ
jgi:lysophospholipase L1-like esterase